MAQLSLRWSVVSSLLSVYRAEHDPLSNDVLVADGYAIDDGVADVPDAPGAGLAIDEARFASEATIRFDVSV